jgi:hypothetical protein
MRAGACADSEPGRSLEEEVFTDHSRFLPNGSKIAPLTDISKYCPLF